MSEDDGFDLGNFVISPETVAEAMKARRKYGSAGLKTTTPKLVGPFVPPVPWSWWAKAARLSGKAPAVLAAVVFRRVRLARNFTVSLSNADLNEVGISARAKRDGLKAMEKAGLIRVQHKPGSSPIVTVLLKGEEEG